MTVANDRMMQAVKKSLTRAKTAMAARKLASEGHSTAEIARKLNAPESSVRFWTKK